MSMSVGWDGDVLSTIEVGKKGGKGNVVGVYWIIDMNIKIASYHKFVGSGRDMSEKR